MSTRSQNAAPSSSSSVTSVVGGAGLAAARELASARGRAPCASRESKVAAAPASSKVSESKSRDEAKVSAAAHYTTASSDTASSSGSAQVEVQQVVTGDSGIVRSGSDHAATDDRTSGTTPTSNAGSGLPSDSQANPRTKPATRRSTSGEHKESGVPHREGDIVPPSTIKAQRILDGFKIVGMNMSNAQTGEVLWESSSWEGKDFEAETSAKVPKRILQCKQVAREIKFYSKELINDFRLEQRVFFQGTCVEQWKFKFGFVIPDSTNTWQQSISAADTMYPAEIMSGNITFETAFYDADMLICKTKIRIFYI